MFRTNFSMQFFGLATPLESVGVVVRRARVFALGVTAVLFMIDTTN